MNFGQYYSLVVETILLVICLITFGFQVSKPSCTLSAPKIDPGPMCKPVVYNIVIWENREYTDGGRPVVIPITKNYLGTSGIANFTETVRPNVIKFVGDIPGAFRGWGWRAYARDWDWVFDGLWQDKSNSSLVVIKGVSRTSEPCTKNMAREDTKVEGGENNAASSVQTNATGMTQ